ncbi:TPA: hypothetical protein ACWS11_002758 [Escherichia coli]
MKFMVFVNEFNYKLSVNGKERGVLSPSENTHKAITAMIKTGKATSDDVKRMRKAITEVMTNFKMIKVDAVMFELNNRPAFFAINETENHSVIVAFEGSKWRKYHASSESVFVHNKSNSAITGNMIEWTDRVFDVADEKIMNVYDEMAEKIKKLEEELAKRDKERNEDKLALSAYHKKEYGIKTSFEEEVALANSQNRFEKAEPTKVAFKKSNDKVKAEIETVEVEEVAESVKSDSVTLFMIAEPIKKVTKPKNVCFDQDDDFDRWNKSQNESEYFETKLRKTK